MCFVPLQRISDLRLYEIKNQQLRLGWLRYAGTLLCLLLAVQCNQVQTEDQGDEKEKEPVARVLDDYLYKEDISDIVTDDMTPEDSAEVVSNYVDNWVRSRLIFQKATKRLAEEDKAEIEEKIKDFRESLITYRYEKQLVDRELDTTVQESELREYYRNNKANFELTGDIAKVHFVQVLQDAPGVEQAKKWMKREGEDAASQLESYCYQYAETFTLQDTSWHKLVKIAKWLPLSPQTLTARAAPDKYIEATDDKYLYLLYIDDLISKNTTAPFSFVKGRIENVVLNKRKVNLIQQKHNEIYAKGQAKGKFEIY